MINAGHFFNLGFDGTDEIPENLKEIHKHFGLGGVTLFARNIENPEQVRNLNHKINAFVSDDSFIISVDQEGGRFQRLKPPKFKDRPRACDIKVEEAFELGKNMGIELSELGFNADWAPVLDVNTNPDNPIIGERSFSPDPNVVAEIGGEFIRGMQSVGVMACGKHYPGHGDTSEDSHLTLPTVELSLDRLQSIELLPYKELIGKDLKCVMTAHVVYPSLDADHPATFSYKIMTELLRTQLGYNGLVVTDDLGMAGAMCKADYPEACILAFAAGCDQLLICEDHHRHAEIINIFQKELQKSSALQKRAEESFKRIKLVTQEFGKMIA